MKLIDLVCIHLDKWPDDECVAITQDDCGDHGVFYWRKTPTFNTESGEWVGRATNVCGLLPGENFFMTPKDDPDGTFSLCEDYETAIITREQFEEHKMKPDDIITPTAPTTCSLIDWRDRIIEIEKEQVRLQAEKRDLYSKISQSGFKLDLTAMK